MTSRSRLRRLSTRAAVALAAGAVLATLGNGLADAAFTDPGNVQTTFASTAAEPLDFIGVDAGDDFSLGWTSDGRLYAWGANSAGQLGTGDTAPRTIPTRVPLPAGVTIASAAAGADATVALATNGDVYTWGNSAVAPSGPTPGLVPSLSGQSVLGVSAGERCFFAWTSAGALLSWGDNAGGRIGRAVSGSDLTPGQVQRVNGRIVDRARVGRYSTIVSMDGGTALAAFGPYYGGQVGVFLTGLPADSPVVGVAMGSATAFAWTADGRLFSASRVSMMTQVTAFAGTTVVGAEASVPVTAADSLYVWDDQHTLSVWGANGSGQLGVGDTTDRPSPVVVALPPGATVSDVAAGNAHVLVIAADGAFTSSGSNTSGQLGTDDTADRNSFGTPVLIKRWP